MNALLRPNYRRAREIRTEIEGLWEAIAEAERSGETERVNSMKFELQDLQQEFWQTGVTSEYEF